MSEQVSFMGVAEEYANFDVCEGDLFAFYGILRSANLEDFGIVHGPALLHGNIWSVQDAFPAYMPSARGRVMATLFEPYPDTLNDLVLQLDQIESFFPDNLDHSMYIRLQCLADTPSGDQVEAWTYIWNGSVDQYRHVKSGNWMLDRADIMQRYINA